MSRRVWKSFVDSRTVSMLSLGLVGSRTARMLSLGIVTALLLGSIFGVWYTFSLPSERQEQVTLVNYQHYGEFDYQVYVHPSTLYGVTPEEEENAVYFTELIDEIEVSFNHKLVPDEAWDKVTTVVEISMILENPGVWQKEIQLLRKVRYRDVTVTFPLDLAEIEETINDIEDETNVRSSSNDVTLKANVRVVAMTDAGEMEDNFVQTTKLVLDPQTMEWDTDLTHSQHGSYEGLDYEHQGTFDYAIKLKPNTLFGAVTLKPPASESATTIALPSGSVYFTKIVDSMDGTFSYYFYSDQPLTDASARVEVIAILEYPEIWSKTFHLVPATIKTGDFNVSFPVDIQGFDRLTETVRDEIGIGSASYDMTIRADVHMVAQTDYGPIDEVFTQSLTGTLGLSTLVWQDDLTEWQSGSIKETVTVPNSVWPERGGAIVGLVLVMLVGSYLVWNHRQVKPIPLAPMDAEALRARKKHKDVIVDVGELPEAKTEETVILLNSLDELIKASDALLKPVLHKAEAEKHTYCVIDGLTRYEYVSLETPE